AEMIDVSHTDLLEIIRDAIQHLTNGTFRSSDFFIGSMYIDETFEARPCYLLTRKGCELVAMKTTGEKGVLFAASYVTQFEQMENELKQDISGLSPLLQTLIQIETRQNAVEQTVAQMAEGT